MTIFQQYNQFSHSSQFLDVITMRYTLASNVHGCTIVDTHMWCQLTLFGATIFFPGPQGYAQAEQYLHTEMGIVSSVISGE